MNKMMIDEFHDIFKWPIAKFYNVFPWPTEKIHIFFFFLIPVQLMVKDVSCFCLPTSIKGKEAKQCAGEGSNSHQTLHSTKLI